MDATTAAHAITTLDPPAHATLTDGQLAQVSRDIIEHARRDHPAECCGLIIALPQVWGADCSTAYFECRNELAGDAGADRFRIHPDDWASAEDLGRVIAVVHSHPDADANPSGTDRVMCERTRLSWVIVGMPTADGEVIRTIHPTCQPAPLAGREFIHGVQDCYTLVRDYYAQTLGVSLPDFERADGWWEGADHPDLYRRGYAEAGFVVVDGPPQLHDVLLMQVAARCDNHAAVFVDRGLILHHLYGRLSGYDVWGGYWAQHMTAVLRHRSMLGGAA